MYIYLKNNAGDWVKAPLTTDAEHVETDGYLETTPSEGKDAVTLDQELAAMQTLYNKVNVSAGGQLRPVYFLDGAPVQCPSPVTARVTAAATGCSFGSVRSIYFTRFMNLVVAHILIVCSCTKNTYYVLGTIPEGYRPTSTMPVTCAGVIGSEVNAQTRFSLETDGQIRMVSSIGNTAERYGSVTYITNDAWPSS